MRDTKGKQGPTNHGALKMGQGAMPLARVEGARSPLLGLGEAQAKHQRLRHVEDVRTAGTTCSETAAEPLPYSRIDPTAYGHS